MVKLLTVPFLQSGGRCGWEMVKLLTVPFLQSGGRCGWEMVKVLTVTFFTFLCHQFVTFF